MRLEDAYSNPLGTGLAVEVQEHGADGVRLMHWAVESHIDGRDTAERLSRRFGRDRRLVGGRRSFHPEKHVPAGSMLVQVGRRLSPDPYGESANASHQAFHELGQEDRMRILLAGTRAQDVFDDLVREIMMDADRLRGRAAAQRRIPRLRGSGSRPRAARK